MIKLKKNHNLNMDNFEKVFVVYKKTESPNIVTKEISLSQNNYFMNFNQHIKALILDMCLDINYLIFFLNQFV